MNRRILILTALLAASCQQAQVTHVVVCWLKTPGDEAARQQLIDDSKSFARIPGVVEVSAGRAIPSTRAVVDSSYDVAVVMKFKDEDALRSFAQHPIHVAAVERTIKPLVARYVVYDFKE
jgi:hypothetical protein